VRLSVRPAPDVPVPDMLHPLGTFVLPMFLHGHLSVKGVTASGQLGFASTAPGHEWDAYNLGEAIGLHGLWSLLPLAAVWAAAGAAIAAAQGRRRPNPSEPATSREPQKIRTS
jgi:hypothetical protein